MIFCSSNQLDYASRVDCQVVVEYLTHFSALTSSLYLSKSWSFAKMGHALGVLLAYLPLYPQVKISLAVYRL